MSNEPYPKEVVDAFSDYHKQLGGTHHWTKALEKFSITCRNHGLKSHAVASDLLQPSFRAACEEKAREIRETPEYRAFYGEEM